MRENAMKFIMQHIKHAVFFDENRRYDKWEYPLRALEELLSNSLAHREYESTSDIQLHKSIPRVIKELAEVARTKISTFIWWIWSSCLWSRKKFEEEIEKEKYHFLEVNERQKRAIILKRWEITEREYCSLNKIVQVVLKRNLHILLILLMNYLINFFCPFFTNIINFHKFFCWCSCNSCYCLKFI